MDPKNKTIHPRLIRINLTKMQTRGSKVRDKVSESVEEAVLEIM